MRRRWSQLVWEVRALFEPATVTIVPLAAPAAAAEPELRLSAGL